MQRLHLYFKVKLPENVFRPSSLCCTPSLLGLFLHESKAILKSTNQGSSVREMNVTHRSWSLFPLSTSSHKLVSVCAWRRKIEMDENKSVYPWAEPSTVPSIIFWPHNRQAELCPLSGTKSVPQTIAFSEHSHINAFSWQVPRLAYLSHQSRETCISELVFVVSSLLIRKIMPYIKMSFSQFHSERKTFICDNLIHSSIPALEIIENEMPTSFSI